MIGPLLSALLLLSPAQITQAHDHDPAVNNLDSPVKGAEDTADKSPSNDQIARQIAYEDSAPRENFDVEAATEKALNDPRLHLRPRRGEWLKALIRSVQNIFQELFASTGLARTSLWIRTALLTLVWVLAAYGLVQALRHLNKNRRKPKPPGAQPELSDSQETAAQSYEQALAQFTQGLDRTALRTATKVLQDRLRRRHHLGHAATLTIAELLVLPVFSQLDATLRDAAQDLLDLYQRSILAGAPCPRSQLGQALMQLKQLDPVWHQDPSKRPMTPPKHQNPSGPADDAPRIKEVSR